MHSFVININGDTPGDLRKEFMDVYEAANVLREAIQNVTIHGRNYQTLDRPMDYVQEALGVKRLLLSNVDDIIAWAGEGVIRIDLQTGG